ncbi:MAG: c-type cytochrome [Planctomycetes bacterium]|nr:c-type cytochrome [Planctomycetota bacterium]
MRTVAPILAFTLAFLVFFVGVGMYVDRISGTKQAVTGGDIVVGPEAGKDLFWGKGTCSNCHKVGSQGSNTRCPDLGDIGRRAAARAVEVNKKRQAEGKTADYNGNRYLIESVADPRAYVVEGYQPIMPKVYETVPLNRKEILSILSYLQLEGGEEDLDGLLKYQELIPEAKPGKRNEWGDAANGKKLFHDTKSNAGCIRCHKIEGRGEAAIGPDLTGIGGVQTSGYLLESIIEPSKVIVAGYDQFVLKDTDERVFAGQLYRASDAKKWNPSERVAFGEWVKDGDSVYFMDSENRKSDPIAKDDIEDIERGPIQQPLSMMPGDFLQKLDKQEILDLVAYLLSQK